MYITLKYIYIKFFESTAIRKAHPAALNSQKPLWSVQFFYIYKLH